MESKEARKYYYRIVGWSIDRIEFTSHSTSFFARSLAEAAAEHFHPGGGRECEWPLDFEVFTAAGKSLGVWTVQRDLVPVFRARKVRAPEDSRK